MRLYRLRPFIRVALLPASAGAGETRTARATASQRPNTLLIVSDDQRWETFTRDLMPNVYRAWRKAHMPSPSGRPTRQGTRASRGVPVDHRSHGAGRDVALRAADPSASPHAEFVFSSDDAGASFACSLDGADYAPCVSPVDYTGLLEGAHSFSVRATDAAGNTGAPTEGQHFFSVRATDAAGNTGAPAVWSWTIGPG